MEFPRAPTTVGSCPFDGEHPSRLQFPVSTEATL
jgi:hypothetical protein